MFTQTKETLMDPMELAKGLLAKKLGADSGMVGNVLGSLLSSQGGGAAGLNGGLGGLVSGMQAKGLGNIAESWLGDGDNAEVSADQLKDVLGGASVSEAAAKLGTDEGSLLAGLQQALPQIVDQSSQGGSLLDKVGGIGGLAGMAKKFL
jgi:uncharacterized protein YidB (DUF937 family)